MRQVEEHESVRWRVWMGVGWRGTRQSGREVLDSPFAGVLARHVDGLAQLGGLIWMDSRVKGYGTVGGVWLGQSGERLWDRRRGMDRTLRWKDIGRVGLYGTVRCEVIGHAESCGWDNWRVCSADGVF